MAAIDTIASYQGTSGSTLAAGTMAAGDSATIRNFPDGQQAHIVDAFYDDVTSPQFARVRSPLLADNVRGLEFNPGGSAPENLFPSAFPQRVYAQDQLIFELSTAATTGKALLALGIYYDQLPGAAARLFSPGDIQGLVAQIKPVFVAVGSGANTAGAWLDVVITTTESLLVANTDYAVLGIAFDQAVAAVAVKGQDTGNLRISAPGAVAPRFGSDYFYRLSLLTGKPCIPVINSANAGSTYVSIVSSAATGAAGTVLLYLAELSQALPS